ncbi:peptide methionine sulfoxide reductase MsrA [Mesorhizobium sp. L-8-10]|uniref:peptide-methionine (S)-S-oxide reductase MsrA n=1 Tax=unclassified Mesorhizobium TaxID=325217 RepID=UPI00192820FE|nr:MULTISPECIES: peptide-methionine (S)-S-oxide reductase MsrA [unclassified Mesorhizobium]BCH26391.1 peptide methionine sulfoxide reductase MsrA [Mesorhizobium sp. L-8-3]BCH34377.1 peptide methionine sulfoxide reductase MsrA [Mesorhizobium sp. L-8-10]
MTSARATSTERAFSRSAMAALLLALPLAGAAAFISLEAPAQEGIPIPAPGLDEAADRGGTEVAVLAGGCFWGVQGVFQHVAGVSNAVSGYAGGGRDTARYDVVTKGRTGHAEAVQITYDPRKISYGRILQIYFSVAHDPTTLNRQGPDRGTQYRSAIFPLDGEQAKVAKAYIAQLDKAGVFRADIVTSIEPGKAFYPAEAYHQDFMTLNPDYPYIVYNDLPKIENLKRIFPDLYRADPVLVSEAKATN